MPSAENNLLDHAYELRESSGIGVLPQTMVHAAGFLPGSKRSPGSDRDLAREWLADYGRSILEFARIPTRNLSSKVRTGSSSPVWPYSRWGRSSSKSVRDRKHRKRQESRQ